MAENIGSLYVRLGLNLSELETGFVAAEQTVRQGIATLNRQQNIVKLKMETDLAGLDAATDKAKILETQEAALTQVLIMQRDKLRLANAAYQEVAQSTGANSAAAKIAEAALERERLAVARLEQQLRSLAAQKVSLDTSQLQDNIARLNSKITNIRIAAEIDTSKLQDAGRVFDANKAQVKALTDELELQRQKLNQLREAMYRAAQAGGADSVHTLQVKTNVLQQIQQINQLEAKLKELSTTDINIKIRAESLKNIEANISQQINQLNARIENIRVKTEIDASKIAGATAEFDKARLHAQGLTQELTLQNQKLAEMRKALSTSISASGLNSAKTINLQTDIQKQIQAIDQLKAKIEELNKIAPPKENKLLSGYLNIRGDAIAKLNSFTTAFSNLQGATSAADSAITAVLGVIGEMPRSVGLATAALVGLPLVFKGIENSIVDMMTATAAAGDATYVMSRGFQMSIKDTGKFVTMCKTAGVEVNDLASTVKRVQQSIVRGGEDAKAEQWLRRYGESAFDASGHLKDLNDMTLALSRSLKRAQADGNGMAFILGTMRSASADAITAIEDAEDVYKQAATIVKAGLANPKLAHEVQGNLNALNQQSAQLGTNFNAALLPVANEIIPRMTERMGKMTQLIADNKDVIIEFGRAGAEAFLKMEEAAETVGGAVVRIGKFFVDLKKNPREAEFIAKYKDDFDIKSVDDLIRREQPASFNVIKGNTILYNQVKAMYQPLFKAIDDVHKEIENKNKELKESLQQPLTSVADISSAASSRLKLEENPELLKQAESVKKILQEASDIQYKLSHSDYQNKQLDLLQWRQDLLNQADKTAEEREAVERLYSAKLAQIQKEHADQIKQYWQNAADIQYELTHTAFEKQLRDIELWKEAEMEKAATAEDTAAVIANAAAKEAKAFEDAVDRIKGTVQTLEDKIFEIDHSQYENDLRKIRQEYLRTAEELQRQGIFTPELKGQLDYLYNRQKQKLDARADESRRAGGDYTKAPEGAMQRGGNNIVVIGADQIIDDGLQRANIGVMVDERNIRAQLLPKISQEARDVEAAAQATRNLTDVQKEFVQQASGFQLIEGDTFANNFQQIEGDKIFSTPTAELQQFGDALQQTTAGIEQAEPALKIAQAESALTQTLNQAAQDLPADYFKNLADGVKAVSDTQLALTRSTLDLIDAQSKWKDALKNMPQPAQSGLPADGFQRLSASTLDLRKTQDLIARQTRELTPLPTTKKQDSGFELGFDHDLFGTLTTASTTLIGLLRAAGAVAPHPAVKLGAIALGGALGAATGKGTAEANAEQLDERLTPYITTDLSSLAAPLSAIDQKLDSLLMQSLQRDTADNSFAGFGDTLAEKLGTLTNIESYARDIVTAVQTIDFPTEVIVTPLSNISGVIQQILTQLQNRQLPPITIAPNIDIDLGGAYVFDDALKKALVDDITTDVVVHVKDAVQQATSKSSYGYSA